jgi:hypothetical protein
VKNGFISVTDRNDEITKIRVSVEKICYFMSYSEVMGTHIVMDRGNEVICKETPEQLEELMTS